MRGKSWSDRAEVFASRSRLHRLRRQFQTSRRFGLDAIATVVRSRLEKVPLLELLDAVSYSSTLEWSTIGILVIVSASFGKLELSRMVIASPSPSDQRKQFSCFFILVNFGHTPTAGRLRPERDQRLFAHSWQHLSSPGKPQAVMSFPVILDSQQPEVHASTLVLLEKPIMCLVRE